MEQIQQHEWVRAREPLIIKRCIHCGCELWEYLHVKYPHCEFVLKGNVYSDEPACITRHPERKCPDCDRQYGPCECGKIL